MQLPVDPASCDLASWCDLEGEREREREGEGRGERRDDGGMEGGKRGRRFTILIFRVEGEHL